MNNRDRHPMMPISRNTRDSLRQKASQFFKEKENRSAAVFEQMRTDRDVSDAKTAKLRALRLAKEDADRAAAAAKSADSP